MVKSFSTILGIGLVVLWICGLGSPSAAGWLTWLNGVAALCAFAIASYLTPYASRGTRLGLPMTLSLGLFACWIVALTTGVVGWLTWWTFAFACAFFLVGLGGASERPSLVEREAPSPLLRKGEYEKAEAREEERRRKSA